MAIRGEYRDYQAGNLTAEAYVPHDDVSSDRRPAVLVVHQWAGPCEFERAKAEALARLGYVGVVVDVYGKGVRGDVTGDNSALMEPLLADRGQLRERLVDSVAAVR